MLRVSLALATLAALSFAQQGAELPIGQRHLIYYDYVENGRLQGGVVEADPTNPLMSADIDADVDVSQTVNGVTTLIDNGPTSNRIDMVMVGDGYTLGDLSNYATHVDNILPTFFAEHPYDDYSTFFNVHRVDVVSPESGVDNDPNQGVTKNTALDMGYWCGGTERLLCVSVSKAYAHANAAPDNDHVLALANSSKYGGAGYSSDDLATLAGNNGQAIELALHETGHSLGNLADEYSYGGSSSYSGPEPTAVNLSKKIASTMANQQAKWHLWLNESQVDTFEGGGYSQFDVYRPTNNSLMNNLNRPFQQVNSEAMVIEFYKLVDPIDDASPAGPYEGVTQLFVDPIEPTSHQLDIQWFADGAELVGQTGDVLDVASLGLPDGVYEFSVQVVDNTSTVRDEAARALHLSESRSWLMYTGTGEAPPVVAGSSSILASGTDLLVLSGSFLDDVSAATIDGQPATITGQTSTSLSLRPTVPGTPGFATVELTGPAGTFEFEGLVPQWPTLVSGTTGVGGQLDVTLEKQPFIFSLYALFWGLQTFPAPVPVAPAYYGLWLDIGGPFGLLFSGQLTPDTLDLSFPIPDDPALAGLDLHLQAWVQTGFLQFTSDSWTNLSTATIF